MKDKPVSPESALYQMGRAGPIFSAERRAGAQNVAAAVKSCAPSAAAAPTKHMSDKTTTRPGEFSISEAERDWSPLVWPTTWVGDHPIPRFATVVPDFHEDVTN